MKRPNRSSLLSFAGLAIVVYLVVLLGQTITGNYHLEQQIDTLNGQITNLKDQNDALSYGIQYYQTSSYQQREARSELGLQEPGENVLILPHPADSSKTPAASTTTKTKPKSNFTQWVDFLTGKS